MKPYARLLAPLLLVALAGCGSGGGAIPTASPTSDSVPANAPVEPRPAPAALGSLAYVLDGDIYVADPDGSNAVRIADGRSPEECHGDGEYSSDGGFWSPDGSYLAYRRTDCSSSDHPWDVVISDVQGNVIATFPAQGWRTAWSPDSTRVAVWDVTFETIGVYGLDGVPQTQLTMPPGWQPGGDHDPYWLPDGTSLMVQDVELPLDGGMPRQLPIEPDAYSPDGSHVVYFAHGSLTIARSDGSEPREVYGHWGGCCTWSPTGERIAFTTSGRGPAYWSAELRVLDLATGSVTLVIEGERGTSLGVIGFSPQGDRILFSKDEGDESSLWSIGVDGSDPRLVVAGTWVGEWLSQ